MTLPSTPAAQAVRDRVFTAADQLWEAGGRQTVPPVDAVRKAAKVNMNDASTVMKEWRAVRLTTTDKPAVVVPEKVQLAASQAVSALWAVAQDVAAEAMQAKQAEWDAERQVLDAESREKGEAVDRLASELEAAQEACRAAQDLASDLTAKLAEAREQEVAAQGAARQAEATAVALAAQIEDLKRERDQVWSRLSAQQQELITALSAAPKKG